MNLHGQSKVDPDVSTGKKQAFGIIYIDLGVEGSGSHVYRA
jgi:hypothetical protein